MQPRSTIPVANSELVTALYQRYWLMLLSNIRKHVSSREDAEDILLEVFMAALESKVVGTLDEAQQLAWLRKIAYNKCMDYQRRVIRRPAVPLDLTGDTRIDDEQLAPEPLSIRNEEHAQLRTHFATLSEVQQQVLFLRFSHGLRCSEIAQKLDKSEVAIRQVISRSLNLLRRIYQKNKEESLHG